MCTDAGEVTLACTMGSVIEHIKRKKSGKKSRSTNSYPWTCTAGGEVPQHYEHDFIWSVEAEFGRTVLVNSQCTDMELGSLVSAVRSRRVLVGDEVRPAIIKIKDGKIHQILCTLDFTEDVGCQVSSEFSPVCKIHRDNASIKQLIKLMMIYFCKPL